MQPDIPPPDDTDTWGTFHDDLDSLPKRRQREAPRWVDATIYGLMLVLLGSIVGYVFVWLAVHAARLVQSGGPS